MESINLERMSRRDLLKSAALLAAGPAPALLYIGAYTPSGQGIYLFSMDSAGKLTQIKVAAKVSSPSWLAIHPQGKYLYTVNDAADSNGKTSGSVTAFSIDRPSGDLTLLNVVSSEGAGPAHLSVDPQGKFVFVANYAGGSIAVLPIMPDGKLGKATDTQRAVGSVGPTQATNAPPGSFAISGHDAPHAHMIQADPAGKFVFHADLGQDRIYSWVLNRPAGTLSPNTPPFVTVPPGDGPRHFAFHPNGRWFYSLQEEASTLILFDYNAANGTLTQRQMLSSLPSGFAGTNFTSEVRVSADGKFLYAANRLHDSIGIFSIDGSGMLHPAGDVPTLGDYPRSFTLDPSGKYLLCCNQRSDNVTVYRLSSKGRLADFTSQYVGVGSPACIVFLT